VSLGVFVQPDETVLAAGGFIVQVMPGASEDTLTQLEENVARAKPVSQLVREGATPQEILTHVLEGLSVAVAAEVLVRFSCRCSRERVLSTLVAMGQRDMQALLKEEGKASVTCEFCSEQYTISREEIESVFAER
jgi:molecular chaperone Hsp33